MIVKVKTLSGNVIELNIQDDETVAALKEKLMERTGIDPSQQKLVFCAKQLENTDTVTKAGIKGPCPIF